MRAATVMQWWRGIHPTKTIQWILLLNWLILGMYTWNVDAYQVILKPDEHKCFFERIQRNVAFMITTELGNDDTALVHLKVLDPHRVALIDLSIERSNTYQFDAQVYGRYEYCFFNGGVESSGVVITFHVMLSAMESAEPLTSAEAARPAETHGKEETGTGSLKQIISPLHTDVNHLLLTVISVYNDQKYLEMRERRHQHTAESTQARILGWSVFQNAVLFAACALQVIYLRRFFEMKHRV